MTMSTTTSRMVAPRPQASSTVYLGATTEYKNKQKVTVKKQAGPSAGQNKLVSCAANTKEEQPGTKLTLQSKVAKPRLS